MQGKVLYKDQPLKGVSVVFHPAGKDDAKDPPPAGTTGEDGTFTLTTGQKDGAPTGSYVVTFTCWEVPTPKGKRVISTSPPEPQDRFRGAYAERSRSTFKVEVKKGENQLEPFHLK